MIGACEWNGGSNIKEAIFTKLNEVVLNPSITDKGVIQAMKEEILRISSDKTYEVKKGPELVNLAQDILKILIEDEYLILPENLSNNFATEIAGWFDSSSSNNEDFLNISDDILLNSTLKDTISDDDFMREAYSGSPRALNFAEGNGKRAIVNSFIYKNIMGKKEIVTSQTDLNEAISAKQQELLETICTYLKTLPIDRIRGRINVNRKHEIKESTILSRLNNPHIYNGQGKKSDFDIIKIYFKEELSKPSNLNELIDNYLSGERNQELVQYLEAYNAFVLLDNFQEFVLKTLGEVIEVDEDIDRFAPNKYKITNKGSGLYTTWRTSDEIWLDKEVNNIAQLLITSIPIYNFGGNSPRPGTHLSFGIFTHTIGKIKLNMYNRSHNPSAFNNAKDRVSERTRALMSRHYSLQEMLAMSRINPQSYWNAIFDILANSRVDLINDLLGIGTSGNQFTSEDLNVIYSIHKELIGGNESLSSIVESKGVRTAYNYYANICLVMDSMFNTKFILYFENENGEIELRMLGDLTLSRIKSSIERRINNALSNIDYSKFKTLYNIIFELNNNGTIKTVKFLINGTKNSQNVTINVAWNPNNDIYTLTKILPGGEVSPIKSIAKELDQGANFILEILGLNIGSAEFQNAYNNVLNTHRPYNIIDIASDDNFQKIALLAIVRNTISNEALFVDGVRLNSISAILEKVKQLFKTGKTPTINAKGLNTVDSNDIHFLRTLALIESYRLGLSTSSLIKDGNGNSVSSHTLSRMGDGYIHQWVMQNMTKESATNHFSIIDNPAFLGLFLAKELKSRDSNKSSEDMSDAEMITANFIYDFLSQLNSKDYTGVTNNTIYILPAVISDKKFIGRLGINLNAPSGYSIDEQGKVVSDMGDGELTWKLLIDRKPEAIFEIIKLEFLEYLYKSALNINADFYNIQTLTSLIPSMELLPPLTRAGISKWSDAVEQLLLVNYNGQLITAASLKLQGIEVDSTLILKPSLVLNVITSLYNLLHPNHPIVLIDQVHFINKKGKLSSNPTFDSLVLRFTSLDNTIKFFKERTLATVSSMLLKGFDYTLESSENAIAARIENNSQGWINKGRKLILAKVTIDNNVYEITSDLEAEALSVLLGLKTYSGLLNLVNDLNLNIEINPNIISWVGLDYLFSEEWMISTVGHHYAHPAKKATIEKYTSNNIFDKIAYLYADEAERKSAQNKRNVSFTATMLEFLLGDLMGIPDTYNIAIIDDVKDTLSNVSGIIDEAKPYDGATFVNPFIVHLENYSLGGAKAGIVKKLFVHYYDHKTGTGGIIKTAGFPLTNLWIKDSLQYLQMMKSMTDRAWRDSNTDELITSELANITMDFDGNSIDYGTFFFADNTGNFFKADNLQYLGNYTYSFRTILVDPNTGSPVKGAQYLTITHTGVNTNYKVWQMFGGKDSYEYSNGKLIPSESSIQLVVHAMNNVGIRAHNGKVLTLDDVLQFMKHSDVHYMPTVGAVKLGAGNINSNTFYTNGEPLNTMRIKMLQAGILLDKEHLADGEEVSLMTLVISACIARGYTFDKSSQLYKALAAVARYGLKDQMDALSLLMLETQSLLAKDRFQELIIDTIIDSVAHESNPNILILTVALKLLKAAREGKNILFKDKVGLIPYSDPGVYKLLASKLSIAITKAAIKIKIDGVLSMLCPSHGIMKLYGNKMLHEFINNEELVELQKQYNDPNGDLIIFNSSIPEKSSLSPILLNRKYIVNYIDGTSERLEIKTPRDYYNLRDKLGTIATISEYILDGRDLGHYNCKFTTRNYQDGNLIGGSHTFLLFDLSSIKMMYDLEENPLATNELKVEARRLLQRDLNAIYNGGEVMIEGYGLLKVISLDSIVPYELILPKFFATLFGLSLHDNLSEINEDFFVRKQQEAFSPKVEDLMYDICLKRLNGNHVYIKHTNSSIEGLVYKPIRTYSRDGHTWRINSLTKEKMYELGSSEDKVYTYTAPNGKVYEVIETSNIEHYLLEIQGVSDLYVSKESQILESLFNFIRSSDLKVCKLYIHNYNINRRLVPSLLEYNEIMRDGGIDDIYSWKLDIYKQKAKEIFSSFLKALSVVAARIPALSMQSFMPMRIVGFDNTGINTAFVSTSQIWLLGSDYDIDAVTITRFALAQSGKYIHWSPLANFNSYSLLLASDNLPFPTGLTIQLSTFENAENTFSLGTVDDYNNFIRRSLEINLESVDNMNRMVELINFVNKYGLGSITYTSVDGIEHSIIGSPFELTISNIIDLHNTKLFKQGSLQVEGALKNFMLTNMYLVIASPSNLIEAQTSVDGATGVVKKKANDDSLPAVLWQKRAVPGDPTVKVNGIVENQVGKKGVGICAVGLKSYFAIFLRNVLLLNDKNATPQQLKRLLLGKKGSGITIKGVTYYGVANNYISGTDPFLTISQEEASEISRKILQEEDVSAESIRKLVTCVNNDIDAAVLLSALLSQATDNAKELSLAKLNAGIKMLGMYIYGITIGMPFDAVADIMMSPSVVRINTLMEGNLFVKKSSLPVDSIFNIIEKGPRQAISTFLHKDITGSYKPHQKAAEWLTNDVLRLIGNIRFTQDSMGDLLKTLVHACNSSPDIVYDKLIRLLLNDKISTEKKELISICLDYVKTKRIITLDKDNYEAFKILAGGAAELRTLGQLLHINQGIATSIDEQLAYIQTLEDNGAPLEEFIRNPEIYIDEYEKSRKHTYNILDVLNGTPQYKEYLNGVYLLDKQLSEVSLKYRLVKELGPKIAKELNIKGMDNLIAMYGRLNKMADDYIMTEWMLNRDIKFMITEGQQYFDVNGDLQVAKTNIEIPLGSFLGKASFKLWMEQTVIPDLKRGSDGASDYRILIGENKFLKDLQINSYDRTPNHISINAYTLPINMSPRTDEERVVFEYYKDCFNALDSYNLKYISGNKSYNILDLFFLYNMVAFLNLPGESYLKKMFEDVAAKGMMGDFYKFESEYDTSSNLSVENLNSTYIKLWATPVGSFYTNSANWIFANAPDSFNKVLYTKASREDMEIMQDEENFTGRRNQRGEIYILSSYNTDSYHVGFEDTYNIPLGRLMSAPNYWEGDASVNVIINHGRVDTIQVKGKRISLPNPIKELPKIFNIETGKVEVNIEDLSIEIEHQLNPC